MKVVKYGLFGIYIIYAIAVTTLLFHFNHFSDSEFGNTVIAYNDTSFSKFKRGDLLFLKTTQEIQIGDEIVFYDTRSGKNQISSDIVTEIMDTNEKETTYVIQKNIFVSSAYVLGTVSSTSRIPFLGYIYHFFTGKIGYFLTVILPILLVFLSSLKRYRKDA